MDFTVKNGGKASPCRAALNGHGPILVQVLVRVLVRGECLSSGRMIRKSTGSPPAPTTEPWGRGKERMHATFYVAQHTHLPGVCDGATARTSRLA